jgi:hypothetical protein
MIRCWGRRPPRLAWAVSEPHGRLGEELLDLDDALRGLGALQVDDADRFVAEEPTERIDADGASQSLLKPESTM